MNTARHNQHGNILFIILIAVALFAALIYAVSQSNRGNSNITREQSRLIAAQIIQYASNVERAIISLQVINNCKDEQISFERAPFDGSDTDYYNANAPAGYVCHVFHPEGGGVVYQEMDSRWLDPAHAYAAQYGDYSLSHNFIIQGSGETCDASSCHDLVFIVPFLKEEICKSLQRKLVNRDGKIDNGGATNYSPTTYDAAKFTGTYAHANSGQIFADISYKEHYEESSACFSRPSTPPYYSFYHVILAR